MILVGLDMDSPQLPVSHSSHSCNIDHITTKTILQKKKKMMKTFKSNFAIDWICGVLVKLFMERNMGKMLEGNLELKMRQ